MAHQYVVTLADGRKSKPMSGAEIQKLFRNRKIPADCLITNTGSGDAWTAADYFEAHAIEADKVVFAEEEALRNITERHSLDTDRIPVATDRARPLPGQSDRIRPIPGQSGEVIGTSATFVSTAVATVGVLALLTALANNGSGAATGFMILAAGVGGIAWARTYQAILHQRDLLQWQCELLLRFTAEAMGTLDKNPRP